MSKKENEATCKIVQDLLPLYVDGVCSKESGAFVASHIKTCEICSDMLKSLAENEVEKEFVEETHDVLKRHVRKEKTMAMKTGIIIAALLMIPVIIAIILTLPGYSDWKINSVLLASMFLVAGMTVVPLISKTKKFSKTVIFSTIALLLIIFFVEMFFDDGGWLRFGEIAFSVVFGLSIVFAPFVIAQADLPEIMKNHKGLITMSWDTIWFYLMIYIFVIAYPESMKDLLVVSTFFMVLVWLIFLTARYLKLNRWMKSGIIIAQIGIWTGIGNKIGWIMIMERDLHVEILAGSLMVGIVFCIIGFIGGFAKKGKG